MRGMTGLAASIVAGAAALSLAACSSSGGSGSGGSSGSKDSGASAKPSASAPSKPADASGASGGSSGGAGGSAGKPNGVEKLAAADIAAKSRAAMAAAESIHVVNVGMDGTDGARIESRFAKNGDCASTVDLGQGKSDVIQIGDELWLRPKDAKAASGLLDTDKKPVRPGVWAHGERTNIMLLAGGLACSAGGRSGPPAKGTYTRTGTSTVNGQPVVVIEQTDGKDTAVFSVATTGAPYLLKGVGKGKEGSTVVYTDYNKPFSVSKPPAAQTVEAATTIG